MDPIKEVALERTYNAPLAEVWQAWTEPDKLKQWWGPNDVSIPECEVDLRVGGKFYIVMEAGEGMGPYKGTKWPMMAEFTVVEPNSKLSYTAQAWTDGQKEETTIDQTTELTFTEENGKTKLSLHAAVSNITPEGKPYLEGMNEGWSQSLDRLNEFVGNSSNNKKKI